MVKKWFVIDFFSEVEGGRRVSLTMMERTRSFRVS